MVDNASPQKTLAHSGHILYNRHKVTAQQRKRVTVCGFGLSRQAVTRHRYFVSATATEIQNNFGRYLNMVMNGSEVIVTRNGREVGRFIPKDTAVSYLTDSLTGILKGDYDIK